MSICPIRHLLWISMSCGSWDYIVQGFFPHKCSQKSSCNVFNAVVATFPLDISKFLSLLLVHETYPYRGNSPEGHLDWWNTKLTCIDHVWGWVPPQTILLPFFPCVTSTLGSLSTTYPSSDTPIFPNKTQGPTYKIGPLSPHLPFNKALLFNYFSSY